jgi:hypothetical protein
MTIDKQEQRKRQAKTLRGFRKIHRALGITLFAFFAVVGITGLLLGWKKHTGGLILAETAKGTSSDFQLWLPLDTLEYLATGYLRDSVGGHLDSKIDRIDVRKDKGILKFTFKHHFTGLQLDGATGALLKIEKRRSDYIEKIHDGSILDLWLNTGFEPFKLVYTTLMGLALIIFTITGFWLWYGPKRMRR